MIFVGDSMNITIIYPDIGTLSDNDIHQGIASISAVLKSNGHNVSLIHVTTEKTKQQFLELVNRTKPDLICFSSTSYQFRFVKLYADWIKQNLNIPILCGGVHATLSPHEVINDANIDMVCIGEGEYPLLDILNRLEKGEPINNIENIWTKDNGKIITNEIRPLISDLDELPMPDYELFDYETILKNMNGKYTIMAGRGCPFDCTYCCNHALKRIYENKGAYVRLRTVDNVLQQIRQHSQKYNIKTICFGDDTFTLNKTWVHNFCKEYPKQFNFKFECNARVDTIDEQTLQLLKSAGCYKIKFGIEVGNETYRKEILHRNISNSDIINTFKTAHDLGLKTQSYNMIGLPNETEQLIQQTINLNKKILPDYIAFYVFNPYTNTELWQVCKKEGFLSNRNSNRFSPEYILNQDSLTEQQFIKCHQQFSKLSLQQQIKSDYPVLYYPSKLIIFLLGKNARIFLINTKRWLKKMKVIK